MTTKELKDILYKEHQRDVRLTIVNIVLIAVVAIAIISFVYIYAFDIALNYFTGLVDAIGKNAMIVKVLVILVPFTIVGFYVFKLVKIFKRPAQIEEFVQKIEEGKMATSINEKVEYKIIINLIKIKLKLFPITNALVVFSKETKQYQLPVPLAFMTDLKTLLSGVNQNDIHKAWYELYDGDTVENAENTVLKSDEEFNDFVQSDLQEDLEKIEQNRKTGMSKYFIYLIPTVLIVVGWLAFQTGIFTGKIKIDPMNFMYGFLVVSVIYGIIMFFVSQKNKNAEVGESFELEFKTKIFNKIINFINPNFKYILHGHINLNEFLEMGFFENKNYDISGNDQIIGKHSGVPFQLCDLSVLRTRNFSKENESPDVVLSGQVFIAKFNKSFKNEVYLVAKKIEKTFSSGDTDLHLDYLGKKVKLEDLEFMKMFNVYSSDPIEARYILSTAMMERIKEVVKTTKGNYLISFRNNRISIANNSNKNNFEVSMFKSITKTNQVQQFYTDLCKQLKMIDDLKLNINIWK